MAAKNYSRRQTIPVLYTRGTNYEVGFDMGRTFASMVKNFLETSGSLNKTHLPLFNTEKGKNIYNKILDSVKLSFPQYIRELEGIADGAQVEFHKLFLLHTGEITPLTLQYEADKDSSKGCSSIIVNKGDARILAHNEDAFSETLNHYYFVVAHIINETPQGKYKIKEERFMSLCYAGHLPGYTMNYNHHGLVFSINTLYPVALRSGKTPCHFITRALLSAENYKQALNVLRDTGVGAGDGCSINLTFLNEIPKICYNIELGPALGDFKESRLDIKEVHEGKYFYHTNTYERMQIEQANEVKLESSNARAKTFSRFKEPASKEDVLKMLGDVSDEKNCVFRENGTIEERVKTIAVGLFDLNAKTFTLYVNNPTKTEAQFTLPLILKQ